MLLEILEKCVTFTAFFLYHEKEIESKGNYICKSTITSNVSVQMSHAISIKLHKSRTCTALQKQKEIIIIALMTVIDLLEYATGSYVN
jgi:hypothetical protein